MRLRDDLEQQFNHFVEDTEKAMATTFLSCIEKDAYIEGEEEGEKKGKKEGRAELVMAQLTRISPTKSKRDAARIDSTKARVDFAAGLYGYILVQSKIERNAGRIYRSKSQPILYEKCGLKAKFRQSPHSGDEKSKFVNSVRLSWTNWEWRFSILKRSVI